MIEVSFSDEKALAMLEQCATQIEAARTLPQIKMVIAQASAIEHVTRQLRMSERVKRAAFAMVIEAEAQLGRITRAMPKQPTGNASKKAKREGRDLPPPKNQTLRDAGLALERCRLAERIGALPKKDLKKAIDAIPSNHRSITRLATDLGFRKRQESDDWATFRNKVGKAKTLAMQAVGLLVRCQTEGRPPTEEEVNPLREAYGAIA